MKTAVFASAWGENDGEVSREAEGAPAAESQLLSKAPARLYAPNAPL